jgi:NTP pyrophosphatase (non-canonical NTP hydrolase)
MMKNQELFEAAIEAWGDEAQYDQAVEECAELIATLKHYRRGKVEKDAVIDELADVYLMLGQLIYMFGEDDVMKTVDQKILKVRQLMGTSKP